MSGAVDEAMAVLNDVKSRQASLAKANARNAQHGPLNHALKSDDTPPVLFHSSVTDQLRARSISSVKSARERDQVEPSRLQVQEENIETKSIIGE